MADRGTPARRGEDSPQQAEGAFKERWREKLIDQLVTSLPVLVLCFVSLPVTPPAWFALAPLALLLLVYLFWKLPRRLVLGGIAAAALAIPLLNFASIRSFDGTRYFVACDDVAECARTVRHEAHGQTVLIVPVFDFPWLRPWPTEDPLALRWSIARRLFHDAATDRFISPARADNGDVLLHSPLERSLVKFTAGSSSSSLVRMQLTVRVPTFNFDADIEAATQDREPRLKTAGMSIGTGDAHIQYIAPSSERAASVFTAVSAENDVAAWRAVVDNDQILERLLRRDRHAFQNYLHDTGSDAADPRGVLRASLFINTLCNVSLTGNLSLAFRLHAAETALSTLRLLPPDLRSIDDTLYRAWIMSVAQLLLSNPRGIAMREKMLDPRYLTYDDYRFRRARQALAQAAGDERELMSVIEPMEPEQFEKAVGDLASYMQRMLEAQQQAATVSKDTHPFAASMQAMQDVDKAKDRSWIEEVAPLPYAEFTRRVTDFIRPGGKLQSHRVVGLIEELNSLLSDESFTMAPVILARYEPSSPERNDLIKRLRASMARMDELLAKRDDLVLQLYDAEYAVRLGLEASLPDEFHQAERYRRALADLAPGAANAASGGDVMQETMATLMEPDPNLRAELSNSSGIQLMSTMLATMDDLPNGVSRLLQQVDALILPFRTPRWDWRNHEAAAVLWMRITGVLSGDFDLDRNRHRPLRESALCSAQALDKIDTALRRDGEAAGYVPAYQAAYVLFTACDDSRAGFHGHVAESAVGGHDKAIEELIAIIRARKERR